MTAAKPKKAATKKAAKPTPKAAAAPEPKPTEAEPKAPAVRGAERARLNQLERWGCQADRCALLGIPLAVGPRAGHWQRPVFDDERGEWLSHLAREILDAKVPPEALEHAAARLADRGRP